LKFNFQGADVVGGIHTDFVFTEFSDRWFIILSQFEKLGTLVCILLLLLHILVYFSVFEKFWSVLKVWRSFEQVKEEN